MHGGDEIVIERGGSGRVRWEMCWCWYGRCVGDGLDGCDGHGGMETMPVVIDE